MQHLPVETLLEVVHYVRPQRNLGALFCVSKWLAKTLCQVVENDQWRSNGTGHFADTHLLTPFQKNSLLDLCSNHHVTVPDVDNGLVLTKALLAHLLQEGNNPVLFTTVGLVHLDLSAWQLDQSVITRTCEDREEVKKQRVHARTEVILATEMVPPNEDSVTRYTVLLSDYVHSVDEYTPLWTHGHATKLSQPFVGLGDAKKVLVVGDVGNLSGTKFASYTRLDLQRTIRYQDVAAYDTFLCGIDKNIPRLYSLLMQFATQPKNIIPCYNDNYVSPSFPVVAKHKQQYLLEMFGGDRDNLYAAPFFCKGMTYAEICASSVGYPWKKPEDAFNWVVATVGECRSLEIANGYLQTRPVHNLIEWYCTEPGAQLTDICNSEKHSGLLSLQRPPTQTTVNTRITNKQLLSTVKHSLECKVGRKGTRSLTVGEAKELCRTRQLPVTGSRQELLQRLENFLEQ